MPGVMCEGGRALGHKSLVHRQADACSPEAQHTTLSSRVGMLQISCTLTVSLRVWESMTVFQLFAVVLFGAFSRTLGLRKRGGALPIWTQAQTASQNRGKIWGHFHMSRLETFRGSCVKVNSWPDEYLDDWG
eukprot:4588039-Amphidinium_carterae.1